ncbi:MAG: hypothetical protein EOM25_12795 [Deltaproteobacteria bacterium]|nr:hypothetical protein [Deltaproteobacteria bacterium]
MFAQDRTGRKWKITVDDQETVHFHVQDCVGTCPQVEVPAAELTGYYLLDAQGRNEFERNLGRRVGLPFWPMFVERIIEAEEKLLTDLGVFGRRTDGELLKEDVCRLIVPMTRDRALEVHPDLKPSPEACRKHEVWAKTERERLLDKAVMAIRCPLCLDDEDRMTFYATKAQIEIDCCAICHSPATAVGVFQDQNGREEIVFHGLCKRCEPRNEAEPDLLEKIGEAIALLDRQGRVVDAKIAK